MPKQKPAIKISQKFKDKLDSLGKRGESYEDIIKRLIKEHET